VWFDFARRQVPEQYGWLHRELIADETTGRLIPRQKSSKNDLELAKTHLRNGDLQAAAVSARSAFEWKLRNICENRGVKIHFKFDPDKIKADDLWAGIVQRQREREEQRAKGAQAPDFVSPALETAVETMRSTVLNKLSHTGASGLVSSEVATAIATVANVLSHDFPKV